MIKRTLKSHSLARAIILLIALHLSSFVWAGDIDFTCEQNLASLIETKYLQNTWGVEIELRTGFELSRKDLSFKLQELFVQKGYDAHIVTSTIPNTPYKEYSVVYQDHGFEYKWGLPFEFDFHNFKTGDIYPGAEITTPIMRNQHDQNLFYEVVDFLNDLGVTPARNIGGTHVHWGAKDLTIMDVTRIYNGYFQVYKKLKAFFKPDRGRGHISEEDLNDDFYRLLKWKDRYARIMDIEDLDLMFRKGPIRYNIYNATLETRFFNSTNDKDELLFYIQFSRRFVLKVLKDDEFYHALPNLNISDIMNALNLTPPKNFGKTKKKGRK